MGDGWRYGELTDFVDSADSVNPHCCTSTTPPLCEGMYSAMAQMKGTISKPGELSLKVSSVTLVSYNMPLTL